MMMTGEEFKQALLDLGWKQSDFCRRTGVHRNSASSWAIEGPPLWVSEYLRALLAIQSLHAAFIAPPPRAKSAGAGGKQED